MSPTKSTPMKKSIVLIILLLLHSVYAQQPDFVVQEEHVEATLNTSSTVTIVYNFTIKTTKGPQKGIYVGIPTDSIYNYAAFQNEQPLTVEKEPNRLKIWFLAEAHSGEVTKVQVTFTAVGMIYPDETGRVGMEFYPCWWDEQETEVLRVKFVLPEGCDISEVGNYPEAEKRGMEGEKAFVYFERANLNPGYKFRCGVSFPKKYVVLPVAREPQEKRENALRAVILAILAVVMSGIIGGLYTFLKKATYNPPVLQMESLGARKDLDVVEAAYVLNAHPLKLINLILLTLVKKGFIRITNWGPVKVQILKKIREEAFKCPRCGNIVRGAGIHTCRFCGTKVRVPGLTSYEKKVLSLCINKDGTLNEYILSTVLEDLYRRVDLKLSGYSRKKTAEFYKKKIEKYWRDFETVTSEEKYALFGDRVEWLMVDLYFDEKMQKNFEEVSLTDTSEWWEWYTIRKAPYGREFSRIISLARKNMEENSGLDKKFLEKRWEKHTESGRPSIEVSHSHRDCVRVWTARVPAHAYPAPAPVHREAGSKWYTSV